MAEVIYFPGTELVKHTIVTPEDEIKKKYRSVTITITVDGKDKKIPVMEWWLASNQRAMYNDIDFLPTKAERDANPMGRDFLFSTFTGLMLDCSTPLEHDVCEAQAGVQTVLSHFYLILANKDNRVYNYLLDWFAYALQKRCKSGVIVTLIGDSGEPRPRPAARP